MEGEENENSGVYDYFTFSREENRLSTFDGNTPLTEDAKINLAKAGFYFVQQKKNMKCFSCLLELEISGDASGPSLPTAMNYHPNCYFIKRLRGGGRRSKKFDSYFSLYYERERLETFIDWPVSFILPEELAASGFYYLRKEDHCACVFCCGTVGAWEVDDTPSGEHQRHFPNCPFLAGHSIGNVTLDQSRILDKLSLDGEECVMPRLTYHEEEEDEDEINLYGVSRFSKPSRMEYISPESRLKTFKFWPEGLRSRQTPDDMTAAGFFYCGLSDHVRCFHCGNGLRNWEKEDKPWELHARYYPKCFFLYVNKGQKFIDSILPHSSLNPCSGQFKPISDSDLDSLMSMSPENAIKISGYSPDVIRAAFRRQLELTGMPFFSRDCFIETAQHVMLERESANMEVEEDEEMKIMSARGIHKHSPVKFNDETHIHSNDKIIMGVEEEENTEKKKNEEEVLEYRKCKICMDADMDIVFLPCGHMYSCASCTIKLGECSICRNAIQNIVKVSNDKTTMGVEEEENTEKKKNEEEVLEDRKCKICMDSDIDIVFLPCCHMYSCANCTNKLRECLICRNEILYIVKVIMS